MKGFGAGIFRDPNVASAVAIAVAIVEFVLRLNDVVVGVLLRVNDVIGALLDRLLGLELEAQIKFVVRIVALGLNVYSLVVQSHCSAAMRSWRALFR